jgi:RNA polymerase sigma-70 factor (ECF subfamily)
MAADEVLMEKVRGGDRAALGVLVERYHAPLTGYLVRMTNGQRELAEDMVQMTFMKLIQSRESYQAGRTFRPWLYTIATNLARDHFRRLETRKTEAWDEALDELAGKCEGEPEKLLVRGEQAALVAGAVQRLSEPLRAALVLRFYQDLSLEEIAQVLEIPLGTVKSRLSAAIRQLHKTLAETAQEVKV